jgi:hypothetical protein
MAKITLYHGTAAPFTKFAKDFAIRGSEANSALGIHLTERPSLAAEYARLAAKDKVGTEPRVLVVEAEVSKVGLISSAADYLGRDPEFGLDETDRSRVEFIERRFELEAEGFDAVATEEAELDDVSGCWVVFDPDKLSVVDEITLEAAEDIDDEPADWSDIDFQSIRLFADDVRDEQFSNA